MAIDVKAFVRRQLAQHKTSYWGWALGSVALTIIVIFLCLKIGLSGHTLTRQAINSGQRVMINLTNGDIDGNVRHTKHAEIKPVAPGTDTSSLQSPIVSKEGLAPAPLATITEDSDRGLLPIAGNDGTLPWKYYARPYTPQQKRPMIAIVLTNLGLSKPQTDEVLKLPHGLTLSFSPYASDAKIWARQAREEGFESLVDLPMESKDYPVNDPGPYGLLDNLSQDESSKRLHWVLSRFSGFVGVLAPEDEKLTPDANIIQPTLIELAARGVLFLYLKTPQNAPLTELAKSRKLYLLGIDNIIDSDISQSAIEQQLQALVDTAKKQGSAIGMAHSYPPTLDTLTLWIPTLHDQGVDLVPVSAIAKQLYP